MASNENDWAYTIHVCLPVWINEYNTGVYVTSYSYSNVANNYKKVAFHSVADVQVHCLLNGHRCYCTRLSRNQGNTTKDSIKHTLTLFPSPVVTPNISWPDIVRTKTCGRVTWGEYGEDVLTQKEQQLLEHVSKKLYKERFAPVPKAHPQPLHEDIQLGSIDLTSTSCFLRTESEAVCRVGDMLFVCNKETVRARDDGDSKDDEEPEVSFTDGMIYFLCRGGSSNAIRRLRDMLLYLCDKEKHSINNTPVLSLPLTICNSCGDKAVALYANEGGCGFILCHPIAVTPARELRCKQHPAGPVHLFSIALKDAIWVERDILYCHNNTYVETLSERIVKALQLCM
jgi:hypothetical protein